MGKQEKRIVGEYRLFHRNKRYGIERSGDMEEGIDLVFVGMLIEVLAHKHEVSPEKMTEILLDGIEKHPVEFKE